MRRGISAIALAAVLALPASALGTTRLVLGEIGGDAGPELSMEFRAVGKLNAKAKFVPSKVREFDPTVEFTCFDAAGNPTSSTRRDDLAPGFFNGLKLRRKGGFAGEAPTPTGLIYTVAGTLRKGRATGTMQIRQGTKGSDGYCSTGTFADPTVTFTAKMMKPVGAVPSTPRSTDCGTYPSTSVYATARVIAIRGVTCARALEVARAYDRAGKQLGRWRCALAHADPPNLFSCGKGGKRGNLRRWPHALKAVGIGTPQFQASASPASPAGS